MISCMTNSVQQDMSKSDTNDLKQISGIISCFLDETELAEC
jgi:hypothetical protein